MKRPLFDIWEEEKPARDTHPFCAQLVNYIGHFTTQAHAERFVAATKLAREQADKSVATTTQTGSRSRK